MILNDIQQNIAYISAKKFIFDCEMFFKTDRNYFTYHFLFDNKPSHFEVGGEVIQHSYGSTKETVPVSFLSRHTQHELPLLANLIIVNPSFIKAIGISN